MAGNGFADQLVTKPTKKLRKRLKDYVLCRVIDLTGIDLGHYDFDPDTTIYCFIINQDEDIYLRYGGRDDEAADTYLNIKSIEIALEHGLTQHSLYKEGKRKPQKRAKARFPRDFAEHKNNQIQKRQGVHCHMTGSADTPVAQQARTPATLDPAFASPRAAMSPKRRNRSSRGTRGLGRPPTPRPAGQP